MPRNTEADTRILEIWLLAATFAPCELIKIFDKLHLTEVPEGRPFFAYLFQRAIETKDILYGYTGWSFKPSQKPGVPEYGMYCLWQYEHTTCWLIDNMNDTYLLLIQTPNENSDEELQMINMEFPFRLDEET